jgi:hypothetical protein
MLLDPSSPEWRGRAELTGDQCRELAGRFAATHYAGFGRVRMRLMGAALSGNRDTWLFTWRQVLNTYGTLAPHHVMVWVSTGTGEVVMYQGWHPPINGPTVPRVSRQQALQIASALAPWNPNETPFVDVNLQMWPDELGIQRLEWDIWQRLVGPTGREAARWNVHIDAITGVVLGTARSMGGPPDNGRPPAPGIRRAPPPAVWLRGKPLDLALGMAAQSGRPYVPVGVAQLLGWQLQRRGHSHYPDLLVRVTDGQRVEVPNPGARAESAKSPATIARDGHLFVSAHWLAEVSGVPVTWDAERQGVDLDPPKGSPGSPAP